MFSTAYWRQIELALWDTAGQEDYDRLRPLSYPDTDVILMWGEGRATPATSSCRCFAIDSPDSLENIPEKWKPEVYGRGECEGACTHRCTTSARMRLSSSSATRRTSGTTRRWEGTKGRGLEGCGLQAVKNGVVTYAQGAAVAEQIGAFAYLECSAKNKEVGTGPLCQQAEPVAGNPRGVREGDGGGTAEQEEAEEEVYHPVIASPGAPCRLRTYGCTAAPRV